jgi:hypothetical protein
MPKSGLSENLQAAANPEAHYKLYLPPAYDKNPTQLFPMLIHHNPGGKTRLGPYTKWADEHGAIVLGIDGIRNGLEQGKKNQIADAVLKDLAARGVRAHPTLRFTIGMSGGSADGMRLVRRRPEGYMGCVFMGAGGVLDNPKAKHLAYAILGGAKDEWMPGDACYANVEKAKALGCPVKVIVQIDRQHREAPLEQQYDALTWMLELQKLLLPSLPDEERNANLAAARQRMKGVAAVADPAARRKEAELMLDLTPLDPYEAERQGVVAAWISALDGLVKSEKDPIARHALIMTEILRGPYAGALPAEDRKRFEAAARGLEAATAVAKDWAFRERYLQAEEAECRAGLKPEALSAVLPLWDALAKETVGAGWDAKVQRRIRIVKQFIETPSTIQHPTRLRD